MKVELITITPECEKVIEHAGRTCYKSEKNDPMIIQSWIKSGHLSVIEHASATFRISGVSRVLTHQLVRHRVASFSQESQRYCVPKLTNFVIPDSIKQNKKALSVYEQIHGEIIEAYETLLDMGIKKEDARFLLPNSTNTEIVMTMNLREFRHFIELRADKHSQWEIQEIAKEILLKLYDHAPFTFGDLVEKFIGDKNG